MGRRAAFPAEKGKTFRNFTFIQRPREKWLERAQRQTRRVFDGENCLRYKLEIFDYYFRFGLVAALCERLCVYVGAHIEKVRTRARFAL